MELNRKLNPSFQNARITTEHPLLVHVCAIAYTCISNEPHMSCSVAQARVTRHLHYRTQ